MMEIVNKLRRLAKPDPQLGKRYNSLAVAAISQRIVVRVFYYLVICSLAFVFLYPFLTMVITSTMSDADLINITVKWIPNEIKWSNYKIATQQLSYKRYFLNSLFIAGISTVGHVLSCSMIGYGFARYRFRLSGPLFAVVILSMLVPVQTIIFPLYIQYSKMGWLDSYKPLIVPTFFGYGLNGAFFIFLFRQFFKSLPKEIEEAARVDGCGPIRTYFQIMLPMSKSSILVASVLSFVWHWNDYFEPNVYIRTPAKRVLPSMLPSLYALLNSEDAMELVMEDGGFTFNNAMLMAGTFLVILPVLIVYGILQKQFMEGVERSGIAGT